MTAHSVWLSSCIVIIINFVTHFSATLLIASKTEIYSYKFEGFIALSHNLSRKNTFFFATTPTHFLCYSLTQTHAHQQLSGNFTIRRRVWMNIFQLIKSPIDWNGVDLWITFILITWCAFSPFSLRLRTTDSIKQKKNKKKQQQRQPVAFATPKQTTKWICFVSCDKIYSKWNVQIARKNLTALIFHVFAWIEACKSVETGNRENGRIIPNICIY